MTPRKLVLGVDVGSGSIRAGVFDADGQALGEARRAHHPLQPRPGVAEYDPESMTAAVVGCLRELAERLAIRPGEVAGMALDGMISGVMGVDADWRPTTAYTTPLDMRYGDTLNAIMARHERRVREITGSGLAVIGPKIAWIKHAFPEAFARTARFVTATGYVAGRLAGLRPEQAFMDYTYLWTTGLSETVRYRWSEELCAAHGVNAAQLPRIVTPTDVVGHLSREMSTATGLEAGLPIIAGAGDQTAGLVGAGLTRPGLLADSAGTYPVLALCTDQFAPDLEHGRIELLPSPVAGQFHACQIINGGGLTHHWFAREFAGAAEDAALRAAFEDLDAKAAGIAPGCDGLFCSPHLGGRIAPAQTAMRGAWIGFTWTHRREHFYRAFLEAIAFEYALALRALRQLHPKHPPAEILGFGGGARSTLWNQVKADVLGLPYRALDRLEQSVWGVALLAGVGVGLFPDLAVTVQGRVSGPVIEPDPARHDAYAKLLAGYEAITPPIELACASIPGETTTSSAH